MVRMATTFDMYRKKEMSFQRHLHVEVYYNVIIDALQSKDGRETTMSTLKRAGVVAGGAILGTIFLGPIGLVIGGGLGGAGAHELKDHDKAYEAMINFLRTLDFDHKDALVSKVEELVGDTDTTALEEFAKIKENRERLSNLVLNYLIDNFNYRVEDRRMSRENSGGYTELQEQPSAPPMPKVGTKELQNLFDGDDWD